MRAQLRHSQGVLGAAQDAFARALLDCGLPVPGEVTPRQRSRATRCFNIYRNNVYASLVTSVLAKFPVVQKLVGVDFANAAARHYVEHDPPSCPVLLWYGAAFPEFLEAFEPAQSVPYLADVARLEWAISEAYSAADAPFVTADALWSLGDVLGTATLTLHPAVRMIVSPFPAYSIWAANAAEQSSQNLCAFSGGETALIVRPAFDVRVIQLGPEAANFIRALKRGATIDTATSEAFAADAAFDLASTLVTLVSSGAIAAANCASHI